MKASKEREIVSALQFLIYILFCLFALSVIFWISRSIYNAWFYNDAPITATVIGSVIIPLFILFIILVSRVFWTLVREGSTGLYDEEVGRTQ